MGGPIGPDEFVSQQCVRLVDSIATDMGNLRKIEACPQQYNLLLAKCYNYEGDAPSPLRATQALG